jgi:hypothetical protein
MVRGAQDQRSSKEKTSKNSDDRASRARKFSVSQSAAVSLAENSSP